MKAILVGLVALAVAVVVQRLMLRARARELRTCQQAFRFHAIRDELQLLAVAGKISPVTPTYDFLMWTTNLAIRNAGVMTISDLLVIAMQVDSRVNAKSQQLLRNMKNEPEEVQKLAAEAFESLTSMLIANDRIVRLGFRAMHFAMGAWKALRPAVEASVRGIDELGKLLVPDHAQLVHYARKYDTLSDSFAEC